MKLQRLFATLVAISALAQQQPQAPLVPDSGVARFSTASNLVIVDVTVKDKSGNVLNNLKQSDFTVTEDGKPQKLVVFEFEQLASEFEPPPPLKLADQLELPPVPTTNITLPAPGQIQYHNKRLMIFYFDFSSMGIPDQLRAQTAAQEFLAKNITKDDMVSIMLYTSQLQVKTDFTSDREVLSNIINKLPIGEMSELAGLADDSGDNGEDTGAAFVADESAFNILNTDMKLGALEKAAKQLAGLPEKKDLIYFSGGVSTNGLENQAQMDATVMALAKANVMLNAIDVRGLIASPPGGGASSGGSRGRGGSAGGAGGGNGRESINSSQDTLATLAMNTGGRALTDSNNIAGQIVEAQQEVKSYYILGYYTSNTAEDGKFRSINVKLNPGLSAKLDNYRKGYYASKVWTKMNAADRERQLTDAITSGEPITELPLALQIDYFRVSATQYFVPVTIRVPGSAVELAAKGGAAVSQFDFIGQVQDDQKTVWGNVNDRIQIKIDPNAKGTRKGFQYDAGFTLEPGRYRLKFVMRENNTGKEGTYETKFVVPDLSADTTGLKTSSIVLSTQREAIKAAVGSAQKVTTKEALANPLIDGDEKVIPNITRVFRRAQNLFVNFDVYDARPDPADSKSRRVRATMSLFNEKGAKAFEVGPIDATQLATTRPEAVPVKFMLPLKDMAPGKYTSQISVIDEVGRKFAFPRTQILVAP